MLPSMSLSAGTLMLALSALAPLAEARSSGMHVARADGGHTHAARSKLWKRFSGRATFYDPETGNQGACGGFIHTNDWTVALNSDQYSGGAHCGQQVTISANGKTQVATIRDMCPGCGYGGLDMTPGLFSAFADHSVGVIQISWNFGSGGGGGGGNSNNNNNNNGGNNNNNHNNNNNNNNNNHNNSPTTSHTPEWTPPAPAWTPEWTPTTSSRRWTSTSSSRQWTPSSSSSSRRTSSSNTWTPSSSSSSSEESSSTSSSSVFNSTATPVVGVANTTDSLNSALLNSTMTSGNETLPSATGGANSSTLPTGTNGEGASGSLANVAQVVLRVANVVVQAANSNNA